MPGYIDTCIYSFFTALSFVFIDKLDDKINPYVSLLYMLIVALVFFNLVQYRNLLNVYRQTFKNMSTYIPMSLFISANWMCSIFAPNIIDPFFYLAIYFMTSATCACLFSVKKSSMDFIINIIIVIIFALTMFYACRYYSSIANKNIRYRLLLGIGGGVTSYGYSYFSNSFANSCKFYPTQVLAVRSWCLTIILLIIILSKHISCHLNFTNISIEVVMSALTLIIPIYFSQSALKKLGVTNYSMLVAFTPAITFVVYTISQQNLVKINFFISIAVTLVLFISKVNQILMIKK